MHSWLNDCDKNRKGEPGTEVAGRGRVTRYVGFVLLCYAILLCKNKIINRMSGYEYQYLSHEYRYLRNTAIWLVTSQCSSTNPI